MCFETFDVVALVGIKSMDFCINIYFLSNNCGFTKAKYRRKVLILLPDGLTNIIGQWPLL